MKIGKPNAPWFVARVKPQQEFIVYVRLLKAGFVAYLPRSRIEKFSRQKRVNTEREEPLMPGYIFIEGNGDSLSEVKDVDGVLGAIMDAKGEQSRPLRVPAAIVLDIWAAEIAGEFDSTSKGKNGKKDALEERFARGKAFRVTDGPFASFLAKSEGVTHADRIKALVNIFGRQTAVEFDPGQLDAA